MASKKKILVVVGAGASIEFGMPSVAKVNTLLREFSDQYPLLSGNGFNFYSFFENTIDNYKNVHLVDWEKSPTNFEEVLGVLYQLPALLGPQGKFTSALGAFVSVNCLPFIKEFQSHFRLDRGSLSYVTEEIIKRLIGEFRFLCDQSNLDNTNLIKMKSFIEALESEFDVSVLSLNYDNLVKRFLKKCITGFNEVTGKFEPENILYRKEWPCFLYLHDSVHFDFWNGFKWINDFPEIDDYLAKSKSRIHTKEGAVFPGLEIIAGYGKASQILEQPFRTYYNELERLVYECDGILVLGYGFSDDHVNKALSNFSRNRMGRPVVIVDYGLDDQMNVGSGWNLSSPLGVALGIFGNPYSEMRWNGYQHSTTVKKLKDNNFFEYSCDREKPLYIWYGGMLKACESYHNIFNYLKQ